MTGIGGRFGRTVRELREAQGWSQEHLAALAELNRTYLGDVERGNAMPSLDTAAKLARALRVGLGALLERCEQQSTASIA
ncbi:helix-turn-helix transcriptional regulator [Piscinibacter sp. XHJ-5]|uniref:helix-turn-helix domain-containing protein n=1 Tax=Piscinibacter sp. XHJ-5 TaxID=3037797 RepID=UPI002452CD9D|nr:helix-turn-helix transcriptional regulator [Piscinibacter sp. XHJ-5]